MGIITSNIIKSDGQAQDPFWQDSASDYLAGNILGLIEDAKPEEININSVNIMTTVGEDKFGGNSNYIKEYFKLKGESSSAYVFASNTINSPNETKGGILSTFRQKIRLFASRDNLSEMLAYSDFDMADIGKQKTAVFIIVQDEKKTYHALATIFIKQAYEVLIDVAQNSPGNHLPYRTNFILDEFANMPALKDITTMVTAARSRHIRFTFIIQNYAQLDQVYGKEEAQTIRSNCANLMYLLTTELAALEEISKLCGEVKSKKDDKTASVPLITVSDLQKLQLNEVIIIRNRQNPFRTKLKQAFNIDWGDKEWQEPAELPVREKKEVALFDVKNFVEVRKRSEMKKNGDTNPFGSGSSPFGGGSDPFASANFGNRSGGGMPSFSDIMTGGMAGLNNPPKKFPTFEEFMAERNKKAETKPRPQIDIDDLVKKIDAQIARLEEEEKQEKAKQESLTTNKPGSLNPFEEKKVLFEDEVKEQPKDDVKQINFVDVMNQNKEEPKVQVETKPEVQPEVQGQTFKDIFTNAPSTPVVEEVKVQENPIIEPKQETIPVIQVQEPVKEPVVQEPVQPEVSTAPTQVVKTVQTVQPVQQVVKTVNTQPIQTQPTYVNTQPNTNFQSMINNNVGSQPTVPTQPVQAQPTQVVSQPVQPTVITQPTVPIKVDTQAQVVNTSDDAYFDDFFE